MLRVENLSVTYGGTLEALRSMDLEVPTGGVVALLGSNGAGKSTTLRSISNNLKRHRGRVTSGRVSYSGAELTGLSMSSIIDRGIVQVPEGRRIFGRLTVEENLRLGGLRRSRRESNESRRDVYELFPRLAERHNQKGLLLSGGEQQMLAIGRALMARPSLLMLDEPSLGLAPLVVEQVAGVIGRIRETGTSVLLIEQNANMALRIADYAYVLERGSISLEGSAEQMLESDLVKDLYLGRSHEDPASSGPEGAGGRDERSDS